jgi:integrase
MDSNEDRIRIGDHVTIYPRGKKAIWTADFWQNGKHNRQSLKTRNLRIARQRAIHLENQLQHGLSPMQPKIKRISIRQAANDFLAYQLTEGRRSKTRTKYDGLFKKLSAFAGKEGVTEICDLDLSLLDRFRAARAEKVGKRSLHNDGVGLKFFLSWCADRQLIGANPLAGRKFRRPKTIPRGGPTLEMVDLVLANAPERLLPIIALLAFTGRRAGDCQHLRPGDVDFKNNWIHVVSRPGAETKSGNSRDIPIHARLRSILEKLPKQSGDWFFTAPASKKYPAGGHHVNMKHANEDFQKILKKLDIPAGKKDGGFTLHSLRSFFKTFCVNAGIPREVVDYWQDHVGERSNAGDTYYLLDPAKSQEFMKRVPFGAGNPAANVGM